MPPITTVASGRCTSTPVPVFNAIGTKPRLATSAVINTGRKRIIAPWIMDSVNCGFMPKLANKSEHHQTIEHRHPGKCDKANPAEIESGISRKYNDNTPPVSANGTPLKIISASLKDENAITNIPRITRSVSGDDG